MTNPAIQIKDLSFAYNGFETLSKVNLSIAEKEFVGIIGPNGGGKTTLLKLIMGLLLPQKGAITLFGKSPMVQYGHMGYVPQFRSIDNNFPISVLDLVLLGALSKTSRWGFFQKKEKETALHLLERLGLSEMKDRPFSHLSGGQAQRALIARALVSDPPLLVLDEPTSNIDIHAEEKIFDLLMDLKGKKTILMVSHDLQCIIEDVNRVVSVQKTVHVLDPKEVCEHFALGLYHEPLIKKRNRP